MKHKITTTYQYHKYLLILISIYPLSTKADVWSISKIKLFFLSLNTKSFITTLHQTFLYCKMDVCFGVRTIYGWPLPLAQVLTHSMLSKLGSIITFGNHLICMCRSLLHRFLPASILFTISELHIPCLGSLGFHELLPSNCQQPCSQVVRVTTEYSSQAPVCLSLEQY